jgi:predicted phosphodiesterase
MDDTQVIAILLSDIHLSLNPPISRSVEPDWLEAQGRVLKQVRDLQFKYKSVPIICAGDIFDKWFSPPQLINWAIEHLPYMFAIPGQHDLPLHRYDDIHKSAYYTLVKAKAIRDIGNEGYAHTADLTMMGIPWDCNDWPKFNDVFKTYPDAIKLAVVHQYVGKKGHVYTGAPKESHVSYLQKQLSPYDAAVFGDNHSGFLTKVGNCNVLNSGCLIQRKIDERQYNPAVGLLHSDGGITKHFLDVSEDKWVSAEKEAEIKEHPELHDFLEELNSLDCSTLDFKLAVKQFVKTNKVNKNVEQMLLELLED